MKRIKKLMKFSKNELRIQRCLKINLNQKMIKIRHKLIMIAKIKIYYLDENNKRFR